MISAKEAAGKWKLTSTRVAQMCRDGEIPGAIKGKKEWLIPINAVKPMDKRRKKQPERYIQFGTLLPLPIGISEYRLASTQYYYIDKTMLIKDFLDERPKVSLFTRPRRFGKTLNMDMLRVFFELSDEDTFVFFQDKKIWGCGIALSQYFFDENSIF